MLTEILVSKSLEEELLGEPIRLMLQKILRKYIVRTVVGGGFWF
jgi:hypothetical protein